MPVQEEWPRTGTRAAPPDLLQADNPDVLRQYLNGVQTRHKDAFPLSDNLIAQLFIIQSELSDQQQERLISAMSLRNITLENYTYEMMKTQYHDLLTTTRTSIQDPSIRPPGGNRSNTFYILEQGEYEGEEGFWVEDEDGLEGFMGTNDEETFWVLEENDAFIARKVSGRNSRFKKGQGKGKSGNNTTSTTRSSGPGMILAGAATCRTTTATGWRPTALARGGLLKKNQPPTFPRSCTRSRRTWRRRMRPSRTRRGPSCRARPSRGPTVVSIPSAKVRGRRASPRATLGRAKATAGGKVHQALQAQPPRCRSLPM